jgi:hypothetical protein
METSMLRFDHRHYVPILKSKRGECWALAKLGASSLERITPLIEFLPSRGTENEQSYLDETCARFHEAWLTRPMFLDTHYLGTESPAQAKAAASIFAVGRRRAMALIPTTSLGRSPHFQHAIANVIEADQRGVVLRLHAQDFLKSNELHVALDGLMSLLNVTPQDAHLVLDYQRSADSALLPQLLRLHVPQLPYVREWASLTAAAGCFPPSLVTVLPEKHKWSSLKREEWLGWREAILGTPKLPRLPAFGDYGVRDPGAPAEGGRAAAGLRYTADSAFLVCRGDQVSKGGAGQIPSMCAQLVNNSAFAGKEFSVGDNEIAATATIRSSAGGPEQWVQWCMNHHLERVASDVALGA